MFSKKVVIALLFVSILVPVFVSAQQGLIPDPPDVFRSNQLGDPDATIGELARYIINILLLIVGIITVFFIIWGGFQYITSGMNEELAENGKKTLRNAIIGLVITLLSYVIVTAISNALIQRY